MVSSCLILLALRFAVVWVVFLSLQDAICVHRRRIAPGSLTGKLLKATEKAALGAANVIFMDTHAHARRIEHLFGLGNGSCGSVWVGAETAHFSSSLLASRTGASPMHVLFYGHFIPLPGVDTVTRARPNTVHVRK